MTTSEILEIVKQMQKNWQNCINNTDLVYEYNCEEGFCNWLNPKYLSFETSEIIFELKKDLRNNVSPWSKMFWYRIYDNIGKQALVTRLNHLNRTVTRLEKELKPQKKWHYLKK